MTTLRLIRPYNSTRGSIGHGNNYFVRAAVYHDYGLGEARLDDSSGIRRTAEPFLPQEDLRVVRQAVARGFRQPVAPRQRNAIAAAFVGVGRVETIRHRSGH